MVEKLRDEKIKNLKQLKKDKDKLIEEQHISVGQLVRRGMEDKEMETRRAKLEKDIVNHKS